MTSALSSHPIKNGDDFLRAGVGLGVDRLQPSLNFVPHITLGLDRFPIALPVEPAYFFFEKRQRQVLRVSGDSSAIKQFWRDAVHTP